MNPDNERPTMSIPEAAKILGIGVNGAYEAAKRGEIPTITIGKRKLVVTAALNKMLGIERPRPQQGGEKNAA